MIKKANLVFNTIRYLKIKQIYYRLFFIIRLRVRKLKKFAYPLALLSSSNSLKLKNSIDCMSLYNKNIFTFLNLSYHFKDKIDWDYSAHGKLWTYNLTYFDYLHQKNIKKDEGLKLIYDFINKSSFIENGLEPFPISLRGINWIKFLTMHEIIDQRINDSLYAQYNKLIDNIEYHLHGNHLLENGFSLLFGAYYFQDEILYKKAKEIVTDQLNEQILEDGAHFELSPMYHQFMLYRVLDCINLVQNNDWKKQELLTLLTTKVEIMLGWLDTITFKNGNIPLLNDSANDIAPTTKDLNGYANRLNVKIKKLFLSDSGYRKIEKRNYEMIVDVGNIGPDYIPGHAHSDTFNFELYIQGKPFIVDSGVSTYETNARRLLERSTVSHNTVQLDDVEQSEVWAAFRVASRAKITDLIEKTNYISASHDGYQNKLGAIHQREFIFGERSIKVLDTVHSKNRYSAVARLHFYPDIKIEVENGMITCNNIEIDCSSNDIKIVEYLYAPEFNKTIPAPMLEIKFKDRLEVEIKI